MSNIPGVTRLEKFPLAFKGSFGRFKTDHSFPLYYLMTSVPVTNIDKLQTASELFNIHDIEFDELIQRDIDFGRVQKIANQYLAQGKGRVIFFPPLLACLVILDADHAIKQQYSNVGLTRNGEGENHTLVQTWDNDGFQLHLPEGDDSTSDRQINWNGEPRYFYEFAATLKLNPNRANLVVLDGQHRLEALRLLRKNREQSEIIANIEIPICIVWAAEASATAANKENITENFRELFVRINSEPQRVSGHFITLLKDNSYSALAVRRLADHWKTIENPGGWNRLHLLEWNTREDQRADVRTREFSITTVSIVAKALDEHLFSAGIAPGILNMESREGDIAVVSPDFACDGIVDSTNGADIDKIVKEQIDKILVPALDLLLRTCAPYARVESSLGAAFSNLKGRVEENNSSFVRLKSLLDSYVYHEAEILEINARSAYVDFKHWIRTYTDDRIYLLSVFQQALIRFWLRIAAVLKPFDVQADVAADVAIAGLEALCFNSNTRFLASDRRYTRRMLWKNENVNFESSWAKRAWSNILVVSLLHRGVRSAITTKLTTKYGIATAICTRIDGQLREAANASLSDYCERFRAELVRETKQSLEEFFGEERAAQLRGLKASNKLEDQQQFEVTIEKKAEGRFEEAIAELADQLQVGTADLLPFS